MITVTLAEARWAFRRDDARALAYYEDAVRRLAGLGKRHRGERGRESAVSGGGWSFSPVEVEGRDYSRENAEPSTDQRAVLPGYFAVLGAHASAGRMFTNADNNIPELWWVKQRRTHLPGRASPLVHGVRYLGLWRGTCRSGRRRAYHASDARRRAGDLYAAAPIRAIGIVGDTHSRSGRHRVACAVDSIDAERDRVVGGVSRSRRCRRSSRDRMPRSAMGR